MKVSGAFLTDDNGAAVPFIRSPNQSGGIDVRYLIIHYTAGLTAAAAIDWFKNPAATASAHLVMDRAGAITQMVGFNKRAWHAGKSEWKDLIGLNRFSIGIELVNAGKLKRSESGDWLSWNSVKLPPDQVIVAQHKNEDTPAGWQIYPEPQIAAALAVAVALNAAFKFEDILGHDDIAPGRKTDPGPGFPMTSITGRVFGRHT